MGPRRDLVFLKFEVFMSLVVLFDPLSLEQLLVLLTEGYTCIRMGAAKKQQNLPKNKYGNWALIAGILSPFFFSLLIPELLAVYLGIRGINKAKELGGEGKTKSIVGLVLGIIYILTFFYTAGVKGL